MELVSPMNFKLYFKTILNSFLKSLLFLTSNCLAMVGNIFKQTQIPPLQASYFVSFESTLKVIRGNVEQTDTKTTNIA